MKHVISWLNTPLLEDSFLRIWMVAAAGLAVILAVLAILLLIRRRRRKRKQSRVPVQEPITEQPVPLPILELANLQGIGSREEQQDAFGISPIDRLEEDGLLAVLCDGMGGMAEGGMIAGETVTQLLSLFPWEDDDGVAPWIVRHSNRIYQQFRGHGGTTLVAVVLRENRLSFWCAGDSDLFLLREGILYALNQRQEYKNELLLRTLEGALSVEDAYCDPQAGALSQYIGKEDVVCDYTRTAFPLQPEDTLLLCSDGISDILTLKQIREAMALPPEACCNRLEEETLAAANPNQDNYTAIVLKYHGPKGENDK